jgi:hypothetical protein
MIIVGSTFRTVTVWNVVAPVKPSSSVIATLTCVVPSSATKPALNAQLKLPEMFVNVSATRVPNGPQLLETAKTESVPASEIEYVNTYTAVALAPSRITTGAFVKEAVGGTSLTVTTKLDATEAPSSSVIVTVTV